MPVHDESEVTQRETAVSISRHYPIFPWERRKLRTCGLGSNPEALEYEPGAKSLYRDVRLVEMRPEIVNSFIGYVTANKNRTQEFQRTIVDISDDTLRTSKLS